MKRCPKCNRTYQDDNQKFCTVDGGRLESAANAETSYDLGPTVLTNQADLNLPPESPTVHDLNKTMASMPPPPTGEIRSGNTGPADSRTIITPFQPAESPQPPPQQQQPPPQAYPPPPDYRQQPPPSYQPQPPAYQQPQQQPQQRQPPQQQQQYQQYQQQPAPPPPPPAHAAAPLPQQQQQQSGHAPAVADEQQRRAQPAPRKGSRMPLIIGAVVLLLLLAGGAAYYFLVLNKKSESANANANVAVANANANTNVSANTNANANTNTNGNANTVANTNTNAAPPFEPPPDTTQFTNSRANLSGKINEHFVPFSFYYPDSWDLNTSIAADGIYFVRAERKLPPDFTQERLAVSWYESNGTFEADKSLFPDLVKATSAKLEKLSGYEKLSEGPTKINSMDAYEFNFKGLTKNTEKGDITFWGRIVFLPPGVEGRKNGLQLTILTSSLAPELKSIDDVGVKGELPVILESFRLK
jgi:hypothetical protein